ncbi:hypothetical protein GCM10023259_070750 [Thermocatellispora tengchongensis]
MAALAAYMAVLGGGAYAEDDPPREVAIGTRLAAQANPAVQLLNLAYTAKMSVPTAGVTDAYQGLFDQAQKHVAAGRIPSDSQSIFKWVFRKISADVNTYLAPINPVRPVDGELSFWCTGWWITPDGYMVTAAHCVGQSDEDLRASFAASIQDVTTKDATELLNNLMGSVEPDKELTELIVDVYTKFNAANAEFSDVTKSLNVISALPGGGMDRTATQTPIEVIAQGEVYPGKDYALLKSSTVRNVPTLTLGTDGDARVGDKLFISGFPGIVTNASFVSLQSKLYPSLTEGAFNAERTTTGGVPYIQAQAPSWGGNSGGPVFNEAGKVIGVLVGGLGSETGESQENQSWILPVGQVNEFLAANNVKPVQSETTKVYNSALDDFFADRYKAALPKFQKVAQLYPDHPYVANYVTDSQEAIAAGRDKTPADVNASPASGEGGFSFQIGGLGLAIIGGGVLLLILIITLIISSSRRRAFQRRQAAAVAPFPSAPAQPWQGQPYQGRPYPGGQPGGYPPPVGQRPWPPSGNRY